MNAHDAGAEETTTIRTTVLDGMMLRQSQPVLVRHVRPDDRAPWLGLWRAYCAELVADLSDQATEGLWHRIMDSDEPIWCLVACIEHDRPLAFAHYVLHPHTFSLQTLCYLEDIFVTPAARGSRVGQVLIEHLIELGRQQGWRRVYWHTHENNHNARALYDRIVGRTAYIRYDFNLRSTSQDVST